MTDTKDAVASGEFSNDLQWDTEAETAPHEDAPLPLGLYVVATPIGNLHDITYRAMDILKRVNIVAAEDTRTTGQLLARYHIRQSFISLHTHNETERITTIISLLQSGKRVALVSDAGTPAISDPGARLVQAVRAAGFTVFPIPGASAFVAAMSAAGWAGSQFLFYGFLPPAQKQRITALQSVAAIPYPVVYYEAPHRIVDMLTDAGQVFGQDRPVVLAKELTKRFETILATTLAEAIQWLCDTHQESRRRGEFVVIILPASVSSAEAVHHDVHRVLTTLLSAALPLKQAVSLTAALTGEKKKSIYALALQLRNDS